MISETEMNIKGNMRSLREKRKEKKKKPSKEERKEKIIEVLDEINKRIREIDIYFPTIYGVKL